MEAIEMVNLETAAEFAHISATSLPGTPTSTRGRTLLSTPTSTTNGRGGSNIGSVKNQEKPSGRLESASERLLT